MTDLFFGPDDIFVIIPATTEYINNHHPNVISWLCEYAPKTQWTTRFTYGLDAHTDVCFKFVSVEEAILFKMRWL